jgi:hypothetical protein
MPSLIRHIVIRIVAASQCRDEFALKRYGNLF